MQREAQSNKVVLLSRLHLRAIILQKGKCVVEVPSLQQLRTHKQGKANGGNLITAAASAYLLRGNSDNLALQFMNTCSLILTT